MNLKPTRDFFYVAIIAILIALCGQFYYSYQYLPTRSEARVYYNRDIAVNKQIIQAIREADKFVYFAVYTFTRDDIADALVAAKERGLEVKGVTDRKQVAELDTQAAIIKKLQGVGIPIVTQDHSAIMHLKVLVTDNAYISGSYNWTAAATDKNDEVIEVGHDQKVRKEYEDVIKELLAKYNHQ